MPFSTGQGSDSWSVWQRRTAYLREQRQQTIPTPWRHGKSIWSLSAGEDVNLNELEHTTDTHLFLLLLVAFFRLSVSR